MPSQIPICTKCRVNRATLSHRWCVDCKAGYMRSWRSHNAMTPMQRLKSNCRSYLHVYIKRGKIKKGVCEVCGDPNVHGHHDDYTKPLEVRWFCEIHHLELHGVIAGEQIVEQ